jgi:hypothetical protein
MMAEKTGRCMCGAVSFVATDMAGNFSRCHCKMCLRWVGGPFDGVQVETAKLTFTGDDNISVFTSSHFAERGNCKVCGSAVFWRLTAGPYVGKTGIPLGMLDDTDGMMMTSELFVDLKNSTSLVPEERQQMTSDDIAKIVAEF